MTTRCHTYMKERPIIFSAPMVRAIMAGRKTQTRRVVNLERLRVRLGTAVSADTRHPAKMNQHGAVSVLVKGGVLEVKPGEFDLVSPYADGRTHLADHGRGRKVWTIKPAPDQRLWVRETFALAPLTDEPDMEHQDDWSPVYRADGDERPWLSSLDESAVEIKAPWRPSIYMPRWASRISLRVSSVRVEQLSDISEDDAIAEGCPDTVGYRTAWDHINGKRAPWSSNPWVWVVSFDVAEDKDKAEKDVKTATEEP